MPSAAEISVGTDAAFAAAGIGAQPAPAAQHLRGAALLPHQRGTRSTSSERHLSICWDSTAGCGTFPTSPTTTAGTGLIRECSAQSTSPTLNSSSGEEINNWLLVNPEVRAHMSRPAPPGQRPKVAMVFFDAETERICDELGYDLILPAAELREHLDSKLVTTRLGNEVGAPSVPNVLITVREYRRVA